MTERELPPATRTVDAVPVEARPFQGRRAGAVTRTLANAVDFGIDVAVLVAGYVTWCAVRFLINPTGFTFPAPQFIVILACGAVVLIIYFTVSWATTGRTYGNHLLGLRVVNFRGERMRWSGAVVRNVLHRAAHRPLLGADQPVQPVVAGHRAAYLGDLRLDDATAGAGSPDGGAGRLAGAASAARSRAGRRSLTSYAEAPAERTGGGLSIDEESYFAERTMTGALVTPMASPPDRRARCPAGRPPREPTYRAHGRLARRVPVDALDAARVGIVQM